MKRHLAALALLLAACPEDGKPLVPSAPGPLEQLRLCEQDKVASACVMAATGQAAANHHLEARRLAKRACELEDQAGCYLFAEAMRQGNGGPVDQASAEQLFRTACQKGEPRACETITAHYAPEDAGVAVAAPAFDAKATEAACSKGNAEACAQLAEVLQSGDAPAKTAARALSLLVKACELKRAESCRAAARAYRQGAGTKADPRRAEALEANACSLGLTDLCAPTKAAPAKQAPVKSKSKSKKR